MGEIKLRSFLFVAIFCTQTTWLPNDPTTMFNEGAIPPAQPCLKDPAQKSHGYPECLPLFHFVHPGFHLWKRCEFLNIFGVVPGCLEGIAGRIGWGSGGAFWKWGSPLPAGFHGRGPPCSSVTFSIPHRETTRGAAGSPHSTCQFGGFFSHFIHRFPPPSPHKFFLGAFIQKTLKSPCYLFPSSLISKRLVECSFSSLSPTISPHNFQFHFAIWLFLHGMWIFVL